MKAQKQWPVGASFLVNWLEKQDLIEKVEEIEYLQIHDANDKDGMSTLFSFWDDTDDWKFWVRIANEYKKAYDSAKLSGGLRDFYKIGNKE